MHVHGYLVALAVAAVVGLGVAAIRSDWIVPWGRARVVRPRLWGYGALLGAVGMAMYMFTRSSSQPLAGLVLALFLAGTVVQLIAQRPGRTHTGPGPRT